MAQGQHRDPVQGCIWTCFSAETCLYHQIETNAIEDAWSVPGGLLPRSFRTLEMNKPSFLRFHSRGLTIKIGCWNKMLHARRPASTLFRPLECRFFRQTRILTVVAQMWNTPTATSFGVTTSFDNNTSSGITSSFRITTSFPQKRRESRKSNFAGRTVTRNGKEPER